MRVLFLVLIKIYWKLVPKYKRRKCIFRISCSQFVYSETLNNGLIAGVKCFRFRFNNCRGIHDIAIDSNGKRRIWLKSGLLVGEDEIREDYLKEGHV